MIELSPVKCGFIILYTSIDGGLLRGTNGETLHNKMKNYLILHRNNSDNDYTS